MKLGAFAAIVALLLAACGGGTAQRTPASADTVKDFVCGMMIEKGDRKAEFDKADYYFCSDECLKKFVAEPSRYGKACRCAEPKLKNCVCGHAAGNRKPCVCSDYD